MINITNKILFKIFYKSSYSYQISQTIAMNLQKIIRFILLIKKITINLYDMIVVDIFIIDNISHKIYILIIIILFILYIIL